MTNEESRNAEERPAAESVDPAPRRDPVYPPPQPSAFETAFLGSMGGCLGCLVVILIVLYLLGAVRW